MKYVMALMLVGGAAIIAPFAAIISAGAWAASPWLGAPIAIGFACLVLAIVGGAIAELRDDPPQ